MNKLVFALGLTTVAFAGSTAWLANELRIERERAVPAATLRVGEHAMPPVPLPDPNPAVATPAATAHVGPVAAASISPPAKTQRPFGPDKEERQAVARDELSRFTDPARRAAYVARAIADLRRQFSGLAKKGGFTPDEETRLFELLAEQQARWIETATRCEIEPSGCDQKLFFQEQDKAKQEIVAQFGQDGYERYVAFQDSTGERRQVTELRARMAEQESLSDAQADRLAEVLSQERRRFTEEARQRGDFVGSFGTETGYLTIATARDRASSGPDRVQSATEFNRRMHDRASEVLSPRQMETFDQLQEEVLAMLREQAHREEIVESVRRRNAH